MLYVVEPCPLSYSMDYAVAKSLSVHMKLLNSKAEFIGDASAALKGSLERALEVADKYRWVTLVLDLNDTAQTCTQWELTAFRLTVVGVTSFVVTIGSLSSAIVQV